MTAEHVSEFRDDTGWIVVTCSCGWSFGPVPDDETAADVWGDHRADATVNDQAATIARLTAELAAERERADRNAELVGVHDPTGRDHMEDAARLAVENDELRAELAAARKGLAAAYIAQDDGTIHRRAFRSSLAIERTGRGPVVDAIRAALDQETTG